MSRKSGATVVEIVVSKRAFEDFKRIWRVIALDSPGAADRLLLAMDAKIQKLRRYPEMGRARDDIRPGARMLVQGSYLILYEYRGDDRLVEIVAVVEGMRDLGDLF